MLASTAPILMLHTRPTKSLVLLRRSDYVWCECKDNYCVDTALSQVLMDAIDGISQHSAPIVTGWHGLEHALMMAMRFGRVLSSRGVGLLGLSHLWCSDQRVVAPVSLCCFIHAVVA